MAIKPYQEGNVWSFRIRRNNQNIYRTGFVTKKEAQAECDRLLVNAHNQGTPKHVGPWNMTLGQAMQKYGLERLPYLKGGQQDANRINVYLRAVGLDTLVLTKIPLRRDTPANVFFTVSLEPHTNDRKIPRGVKSHRAQQDMDKARTDKVRKSLASLKFGEICAYQIQELINIMCVDGYGSATVSLERSLLRSIFNFARKNWLWKDPVTNPAGRDLSLPKIDNNRSRILTNKEWREVLTHLEKENCKLIAPAIALLLETAMRASEPLLHAQWGDVDWQNCTLHLIDSKTGPRDVPLSPSAMSILQTLKQIAKPDEDRILPTTYETLKAGWNRARRAADIEDVNIHDLRHTAATRFTLELNGNLPILKVITGHKTYSQLARYINLGAADVSRLLHKRPLTEDSAPAGYAGARPTPVPLVLPEELPANVLPLRRPQNQPSKSLAA